MPYPPDYTCVCTSILPKPLMPAGSALPPSARFPHYESRPIEMDPDAGTVAIGQYPCRIQAHTQTQIGDEMG